MAYSAWSVIAGEQPTAAKWNILGTNDASFNDGSGLAFTTNNVVPANALATNAITIGYAQITGNLTTTSASAVQATGLTITVTIPAGSRRVELAAYAPIMGSTGVCQLSIWDGVVASGTQVQIFNTNSGQTNGIYCTATVTPAAGSKTYNIGFLTTAGTCTLTASATNPAFVIAKVI